MMGMMMEMMMMMMMMIVEVNDIEDKDDDHLPLFHRKVKDLPSERVTGQLDPDVREEKVGIVMNSLILTIILLIILSINFTYSTGSSAGHHRGRCIR